MKNLLLFLSFSISSIRLVGQTYHPIPFADSGVVWSGYRICVAHGNGWTQGWNYEMSADTVIRNISYRKISGISQTIGFIRKDSSENVFYILSEDSLEFEKPLYDFSLLVGDTLFSGSDFFAVTNIDTVNLEGILRKRWLLDTNIPGPWGPNWTSIWIEGFGEYTPLGVYGYPKIMCSLAGVVTCNISLLDTVIYHSPDTQFGYCNPNAINSVLSEREVRIYPNPAFSSLTISLDGFNRSPTKIQIVDLLGQLQWEENYDVQSEHLALPIGFLPNGMFFLKLSTVSNGGKTLMFVKAD